MQMVCSLTKHFELYVPPLLPCSMASTKLKYTVSVDTAGTHAFVINLPAGLTIQNRKLHRSCMEYTVNGGYVYDSNQNAQVKFGTAPDNWAVRAAIKRARNHWLKMHKELLDNNEAIKPKWHDFKMKLLDGQNNSRMLPTYNVPEDIDDINLPHEEKGITWSVFTTEDSARIQMSGQNSLESSDKDEFTAHLLGGHIGGNNSNGIYQYESIGALESWINSRPDLEPVSTISDIESDRMQQDPLNMLFNDGGADNEIIENFHNAVEGDGNQDGDIYPMYSLDSPPNAIQEVAAAFTTGQTPVGYFTGFKAMLGQVYLKIKTTGPGDIDILFDVNPRGESI